MIYHHVFQKKYFLCSCPLSSLAYKKRKHLSDIVFKQILKDANEYLRKAQYEIISDYYDANKDKIRDPDLIYPGQIFDLPDNVAVN